MRRNFFDIGLVGVLCLTVVQAFAQSAAARSIVVPANVHWTATPLSVRQGHRLRIAPTGEIRLSTNRDDVARPAGVWSGRPAPQAPIPTVPMGALIGRINSGRPFPIGERNEAIEVPASGRLFLGVNDDHVADNSGNYIVRIWEP